MSKSSAASERNFSTMMFIHSIIRNILSVVSVEQLVFIQSNTSAFHDMLTAEYYPSDEEGDPNESDSYNKKICLKIGFLG